MPTHYYIYKCIYINLYICKIELTIVSKLKSIFIVLLIQPKRNVGSLKINKPGTQLKYVEKKIKLFGFPTFSTIKTSFIR